MWEVLRQNFDKDLMSTQSYFRSYSCKHNEGSLDKGKPIPQASFFGHFFENGHNGKFTVGIKIIDGAEDD